MAAGVAAGANANPTTQVSKTPGVPTYLRPRQDIVTRISGTDPIATSIAGSQARWPSVDEPFGGETTIWARQAVIASTSNLPTMLAGARMVDDGPLLFTGAASLDPRTAAELQRALGKVTKDSFQPTVTILGGTDSVSTAVENAIRGLGYQIERVTGKDPQSIAVTAAGPAPNEFSGPVFVVDAADVTGYAAAISSMGSGRTRRYCSPMARSYPTGSRRTSTRSLRL